MGTRTAQKGFGSREGEDCMGGNWQELVIGEFDRGNNWTRIWKYYCDLAAGGLNDTLNDMCGS